MLLSYKNSLSGKIISFKRIQSSADCDLTFYTKKLLFCARKCLLSSDLQFLLNVQQVHRAFSSEKNNKATEHFMSLIMVFVQEFRKFKLVKIIKKNILIMYF